MHPSYDSKRIAYEARIDEAAAEIRDLLDAKMPTTAEWLREDSSICSVIKVVLRDIIECETRDEQTMRVLAWVQYLRDLDPR